MTTAVDTSVLLDVLSADAAHGEASRAALRQAYDKGRLVVCEVVWAEVRAAFEDDLAFRQAMQELSLQFMPATPEAAALAGQMWRSWRRRGGRRRDRVVADFLIGAHASHHAEALLTRDRGFYRTEFGSLRLITP